MKRLTTGLASREDFKTTLDGKQVDLFYLKNKGIEATFTNYGARIINLLTPNSFGEITDVIIGFDTLEGIRNGVDAYHGATIGRYANRIAKGKLLIDGVEYQLPTDAEGNCLHGGSGGFHTVVWDAVQLDESTIQFTYLSKDAEKGFPGNLLANVIYSLTDAAELKITYSATTDQKTVCNLTNHSFFNLNGTGSTNKHKLRIYASLFLPINAEMIPIGNYLSVENTAFDFLEFMEIGSRINNREEQLLLSNGYDHTFVLNKHDQVLQLAAEIIGDKSKIFKQVYTTEPGLQFYGGNFMQGKNILKNGVTDEFRTAFCLETQHFPDSPNQLNFPSTILEPGKEFASTTIYKFFV